MFVLFLSNSRSVGCSSLIYDPFEAADIQVKAFIKGSVSGSGTGPGDRGSRGPAMPDPETFPYEWLGVRQ